MRRPRKSRKLRGLENRRERTLNVCLPHAIKDRKEVEALFVGDFQVKLPRQTSRSCHVVFANAEEKLKNLKLAKNKTVDGKRVVVKLLHDVVPEKSETTTAKKRRKKKIFMPAITPDVKVTQKIFVANLEITTRSDEVRGALAGCVSVTMLKPYNKKFRGAIAKMENIQIAAEYLRNKSKWPIVRGHKVSLKPDTRTKHKRKARSSTETLKIYDGATEVSEVKEESECSGENDSSDGKESNDES